MITTATARTASDVEAVGQLKTSYDALLKEIGKVIIGQEPVIEQMLISLLARGHCLLVGVPGLAKTLLIKTLSQVLDLKFNRIQFTPDLMPSDITGTEIIEETSTGGARTFAFIHGPIFANIVLADEVNRTPPKTQAALLEAMQEHRVTAGGRTHVLQEPFFVLATQNPIEQEGTYPLPEAQLDRFMLSIHLDYPSHDDEVKIAERSIRAKWDGFKSLVNKDDFCKFTELVDKMPVSRHVLEYAVALTTSSRPKDSRADDYIRRYVAWGAGPRATQHLVTASKASALLDGRPTPETKDLQRMAVPVLRHRIIPNYNALGEGIESGAIVKHLVESVREPSSTK